jgi:hypothetical protein
VESVTGCNTDHLVNISTIRHLFGPGNIAEVGGWQAPVR